MLQIKYAIARAFGVWPKNVDATEEIEKKIKFQKSLIKSITKEEEKEKANIMLMTLQREKDESLIALDKIIDEEKLKWFEENKDNLNYKFAKHPTEARAQLKSLLMAETIGSTNIPIELDATNSQMQMVAVLMGDLKTAEACNIVTDNMTIRDAYKILANYMGQALGLRFNRSQIKKSMMIDGYGAGKLLVTNQLFDDLKESFTEKCIEGFYNAQQKMSPATQILKETFMSIWDDSKKQVRWTLPNGAQTDYRPIQTHNITVNPFGMYEIELMAKINLNTSRSTGLGVNVIHSVDAYVCNEMVIRHPNNMIWTIHDGYKVHPNDAAIALKNYNDIMAEIVDSTLLEDIIEEITGVRVPDIKKQFTGDDVRKSKYSIS